MKKTAAFLLTLAAIAGLSSLLRKSNRADGYCMADVANTVPEHCGSRCSRQPQVMIPVRISFLGIM